MSDQLTPERILQVGLGFWASKALLSATELGLFTELAKQPLSAHELKDRLGLHERSARDFFDALVALGFLRRVDGKYHNTPDVDLFLDRAKSSYIGGVLEMAGRRLFGFWANLTEALRTGQPQNEAKGGTAFFADIYADPNRLKGFLEAMTSVSYAGNVAIARQFPFKRYKRFADLGAAQGGLALQIALFNQDITGIGFDLPAVKPIFEDFIAKGGVASRVSFHGGDFFKDPLPAAEVMLMGHILHDWNLEEKRCLVRKVYEALPAGGAFIVYESLIDDDRSKNTFGLLMSLNMLIETPGGFDYTAADCIGWMKEAGFREMRVEHLNGPDSMVVGIK